LTVLVSPKWILVVVLEGPYIHTDEGLSVYLDGFAFLGLVNLQSIEKNWPETAGSAK